jgi:hypothetical protein
LPRIIKFIIFLVLFGIIFEAGLLSSYTIVTSQPPDVGKLVDMQVSKLTDIWNSIGIGIHKSTTKTYNVTNPNPVAQALQSKTGLDGIDISTLSATIVNTNGGNMNVTLTATGYKDNQSASNNTINKNFTSGQVVITPTGTFTVTATATATTDSKGVKVDPNTIQITALKQVYSQ